MFSNDIIIDGIPENKKDKLHTTDYYEFTRANMSGSNEMLKCVQEVIRDFEIGFGCSKVFRSVRLCRF